jgi:[lysine-biosynthesis-protein LysW]--L-2-aminoadipate ligase
VDMMEDKNRGLVVHEVNNTVEFRGAASVSKADIPNEMIDYAVKLARK